jgi:hypothetical protein
MIEENRRITGHSLAVDVDNPSEDAAVIIAILRGLLDEVFTDRRFFARRSMSACQIADYVLSRLLHGERNLDLLRASAFEKLSGAQPVLRLTDLRVPSVVTEKRCSRSSGN